jgi:hypothetical protein
MGHAAVGTLQRTEVRRDADALEDLSGGYSRGLFIDFDVGVRVGADYRRRFGNVDDPNGIRFHAGIVVGR